MDNELRVWLKTFDGRLSSVESSIKTINHELGEVSGQLKAMPKNGKVNPTVYLLVRWVVMPLIVILGSLWGVTNIFGG